MLLVGGLFFFFFQAEDGIRDLTVTGVQTCALPISAAPHPLVFLRVQAFDTYEFEGMRVSRAASSDFVLVNLFREPVGAPMRPDAIGELVTAACGRAGLERSVTAHQLRRACGSNLLDAGGALDEAQDILGHASRS